MTPFETLEFFVMLASGWMVILVMVMAVPPKQSEEQKDYNPAKDPFVNVKDDKESV